MLLDCRDSFFPKINFAEFHFRFMLLIAAPKGGVVTPTRGHWKEAE
jgi:hypothetical protein